MKECPNHHFYDETRYSQCPECLNLNAGPNDTTPYQTQAFAGPQGGIGQDLPPIDTVFMDGARGGAQTAPTDTYPGSGGDERTRPRHDRGDWDGRDPEATQRLVVKRMGIDPVVGWLVCIEGPEKGRDYRIKSHRNFIGRDNRMDICIPGDGVISRENHAIISYDPRSKTFLLTTSEGKHSIYVNDKLLVNSVVLGAYDRIEMGESTFAFLPFCGSNFHWEDDKDKAQQNERKNP